MGSSEYRISDLQETQSVVREFGLFICSWIRHQVQAALEESLTSDEVAVFSQGSPKGS